MNRKARSLSSQRGRAADLQKYADIGTVDLDRRKKFL